MTNCPNCGAPKSGPVCAYCGTVLEAPEKALQLAAGKEVDLSFTDGRYEYRLRMRVDEIGLTTDVSTELFYDMYGGHVRSVAAAPRYGVSISGKAVPSDRGCLLMVRELAPEEITE